MRLDPDSPVLRLARNQDAVVVRQQVRTAGIPPHVLRRLLEDGVWLPLLRGTYSVEPHRTGVLLQRTWARAAVLAVPGAVMALSTAAALHGFAGAPRTGVVDVAVPGQVRRRTRLEPHRLVLAREDVVDVDGLPVTSPLRTLVDLVPRLDRPDALAVLDSALALGLVDRCGLARAAARAAGHRGCRRVEDLWALADPRAESPLESRARLRCIDADLPPDHLQLTVRDEHGHVLARADMAFERRTRRGALPLLLEADGTEHHDSPRALHRDRWRHNTLVALGYETIRCTWADTLSRGALPAAVRRAL